MTGSPSISLNEINTRQSLVAFFYTRPHFRADLIGVLENVEDIGRISQKFLLGRGDVSDLLALSKTIHAWSNIKILIEQEKSLETTKWCDSKVEDWSSIDALVSKMSPLDDLANKILDAIEEDSPFEGSRSIAEQDDAFSVLTDSGVPEPGMNGAPRFCSGKWVIKQRFASR